MVLHRSPLASLITVWLAAVSQGCATTTTAVSTGVNDQVALADVQAGLLARAPDTAVFASPGPFAAVVRENVAVPLDAGRSLIGDFVETDVSTPAPLVILLHGNHSRKEAHRRQAELLAGWGLHALVLQLPNTEHWVQNGRDLAALVGALGRHPDLLGPRINAEKIILVGHSFGGSAVVVAAGSGAAVRGVVLLDPAVFSDRVLAYMRQIRVPVMLLGADAAVFRSRRRRQFFGQIPAEMGEISIVGATHDDAQNPSMFSLYAFGLDPFTSRQRQARFTAALAASAFSLAAYGDLDYAWRAFEKDLARGQIKNARLRHKADDGIMVEIQR
jgi:pimeloyl-ACP methyl ester carboxylesterase